MWKQSGWTLVELMAALGVVAILAAYAYPSADAMLSRSKSTAALNRLVGAVNLARSSAVQYGTMATLCSLNREQVCTADWSNTLTVFLDTNHDGRLDPTEILISRLPASDPGTSVTWRAFGRKKYIQLTPFGYTNYQNGNFVVCPSDGDVAFARQVVVNVQGRARVNHQRNDAGLPVDRKGKVLRC